MGKRATLLRRAARPHGPGDAGGYNAKTKASLAIKKKIKKKVKIGAAATGAGSTRVNDATTKSASGDMFSLALPTVPAGTSCCDEDAVLGDDEMQQQQPAFQDNSKEAFFRQVLNAAASSKASGMIPADEHRARCNELKRLKAERAAKKAERFAAHKKC
jgi:hypothetical protein